MAALTKVKLCQLDDSMSFIGATVLIEGEHVALFYIPDNGVYAVQDWDPIGKAYVMSRGIVGDIDGEMCCITAIQTTLQFKEWAMFGRRSALSKNVASNGRR